MNGSNSIMAAENTFAKPDFAFPQTVSANAKTEYEDALRRGDDALALKAAIQLAIADLSISIDSVDAQAARFEYLESKLTTPYRNLSALFHAKLLSEVYSSDSYRYNTRQIPLSPRPASVKEWNRDIFAQKMDSLISFAVGGEKLAFKPLKEISSLLINVSDGEKAGMSVLDFISMQSVDILLVFGLSDAVPFRFGDITGGLSSVESCNELSKRILEESIKRNKDRGKTQLASYFSWEFLNNQSDDARSEKLLGEYYQKYKDTPYGAQFVGLYVRRAILGIYKNNESQELKNTRRQKGLAILEEYLKKYPAASNTSALREAVNELRSTEVNISVPNQILENEEWKLSVKTSNLYSFNILIYKINDTYNGDKSSIEVGRIPIYGKLSNIVPVTMSGIVPDEKTDTLRMVGLPAGRYVFVVSKGDKLTEMVGYNARSSVNILNVSNITYFLDQDEKTGTRRLYIADGHSLQPLEGAEIRWTESVYRGTGKTGKSVSGADGSLELPNLDMQFVVQRGGSKVWGYISKTYKYTSDKSRLSGTVLTDLSLYKPGQRLGFVGLLYKIDGQTIAEYQCEKVWARLYDVNYQRVDSLDLITDRNGRVAGSLHIPDRGLSGNYRIEIGAGKKSIVSEWVTVAEYKQPTFMVESSGISGSYALGDTLCLKGRAVKYTGIGVAGGKVKFQITYLPNRWSFRGFQNSQTCGGETVTKEDGSFIITLPTATLKDTPYAKGIFRLSVSVTDAAGETQEAKNSLFSLISDKVISLDIPGSICVDSDETKLNVKVSDITGHPVVDKVYYRILQDGRLVEAGEFESPDCRIDLSHLPSGRYKFAFSLDQNKFEDNADTPGYAATDVVLWRKSDKKVPVESILWLPVTRIEMERGQEIVEIPIGSSYENSYIHITEFNNTQCVSSKWLVVNSGIVRYPFSSPKGDERVYLCVTAGHNLEIMSRQVTVIPYSQTLTLEITTESFRDLLTPGDRESWKFKLSVDGQPMGRRPVMAVMSNKALNAIVPFQWYLNPYGELSWQTPIGVSMKGIYNIYNSFYLPYKYSGKEGISFKIPGWNLYGMTLYPRNYYASVESVAMSNFACGSADGAMMRKAKSMAVRDLKAESNDEAAADDSLDMEAPGQQSSEASDQLRPVEMPLAFFMPDMMTDQNGIVHIDFEVPQFNGKWQFQLAGVSEDMHGAVKMLDAVATKQVMVQLNSPRFLRTGDDAQISATLYNNSESTLSVVGRIEILDAGTGEIIASTLASPEEIGASGQRIITINFNVPENVNSVYVRGYAEGGTHRDGEGTEVAVLPSSAPVIESSTFYLEPGKSEIRVEIPVNAEDSQVSLQYCGNPIWECVTALPAIVKPQSKNALSQLNALYGVSIAEGLISKYPMIAEGIRTFAAEENEMDSTLVSKLERNGDLKIVDLQCTPWVNNAQSDSQRMQSLVEYLDSTRSERAITDYIRTLSEYQNNDGGFSWCEGMASSQFVTGRVLLHFAMLNGMGFLPVGGFEIAEKGFRYCDSEMLKMWERNKRQTINLSTMLNYLYVKIFFPEIKDISGFSKLRAQTMEKLRKEWRGLSIYDKGTAAMLLYKTGDANLSHEILESLSQYASSSKEKGMWFDNVRGEWSAWNPIIITAHVLEAYSKIEPDNKNVDLLRQWLLISKQSQEWGDLQGISEVIYAILSSGTDWLVGTENTVVKVGGKELTIPNRSKITDSFVINLSKKDLKAGAITIEKNSAGPSWGGVVVQTVLPILDVKAESIPELSITKNIYSISESDTGTSASSGEYKVGDKVRITLTISCDRDMEYVAVTDSRSACMAPIEQTSGYTSRDGIWYYQENRNEGTNLFIPYLSKGTHILSYDCYLDRAGSYSVGIATAQSQYAPVLTAHSGGKIIDVE